MLQSSSYLGLYAKIQIHITTGDEVLKLFICEISFA